MTAQTLRVASYNILANAYVNPEWYAHVEPEVLEWETRKLALAQRLETFDADVICLQEAEEDAHALFERCLGARGYRGVYARKQRERPDGCSTLFRREGLQFTGSETVYYHDGLRGQPDSGHLALITRFECALGSLRVVNTHVRWDRRDKAPQEHVGYRQIAELIHAHIKTKDAANAWIVCGDFNAESHSPIVQELLANGFQDAYAGHEQNTCNPNHRAKRIDYLFHTPNLTAQPAKLPEIDDLTPLPSREEPSDHLAVMATFTRA